MQDDILYYQTHTTVRKHPFNSPYGVALERGTIASHIKPYNQTCHNDVAYNESNLNQRIPSNHPFYNYYCYYNRHPTSRTVVPKYHRNEVQNRPWKYHYQDDHHEISRSNICDHTITSVISDADEDPTPPCRHNRDHMTRDYSRRYSLSNGSIFFPSVTLRDLDKIDTSCNEHGAGNFYTVRDAKLFVDVAANDHIKMDKSECKQHIESDDSLHVHPKKYGSSFWDAISEEGISTASRRGSLSTISCSRRGSLSESTIQDEISVVSIEPSLLDDVSDREPIHQLEDQYNGDVWQPTPVEDIEVEDYGCTTYGAMYNEPIPLDFSEPTDEEDQVHPNQIGMEHNLTDPNVGNVWHPSADVINITDKYVCQNYVGNQSDYCVVSDHSNPQVEVSQATEQKELAKIPSHSISTVKVDDFRSMMQSLVSAMGETLQSQQSIHEWDKKMGLKRSHSKTMRMSMRTRKKLRVLVRKELNAK